MHERRGQLQVRRGEVKKVGFPRRAVSIGLVSSASRECASQNVFTLFRCRSRHPGFQTSKRQWSHFVSAAGLRTTPTHRAKPQKEPPI